VAGVAPALFDWLRLGTDAGAMCAEVGVCPAPPPLFAVRRRAGEAGGCAAGRVLGSRRRALPPPLQVGTPPPRPGPSPPHPPPPRTAPAPRPQAASRRPRARSPANDATCPLCVFVVSKVKEGLEDPATREAVHAASHKACALMPEGGMRDTCDTWADQYGGRPAQGGPGGEAA
jgi:hypothetical protein